MPFEMDSDEQSNKQHLNHLKLFKIQLHFLSLWYEIEMYQ